MKREEIAKIIVDDTLTLIVRPEVRAIPAFKIADKILALQQPCPECAVLRKALELACANMKEPLDFDIWILRSPQHFIEEARKG